jgi:hypothetical protein
MPELAPAGRSSLAPIVTVLRQADCNANHVRFRLIAVLITVLITVFTLVSARRPSSQARSQVRYSDLQITWHTLEAPEVPAVDVSQHYVPPGVRLQGISENAGDARKPGVTSMGNVSVTAREHGDVLMFRVAPQSSANGLRERLASRPSLHGTAFRNARFACHPGGEIFKNDGIIAQPVYGSMVWRNDNDSEAIAGGKGRVDWHI